MLYNFNWLGKGEEFPPKSELERLKKYNDNRKLFYGETEQAMPQYRQRIRSILDRFTQTPEYDYKADFNYWQLVTVKTGDMICGEPPSVTCTEQDALNSIVKDTALYDKLLQAVYDVSRFGDAVLRVKRETNGKNNFVVISPDMWFPIVSQEDSSQIIAHVMAWVEELASRYGDRPSYVLKTQIHYVGYYVAQTYAISSSLPKSTIVLASGLNVDTPRYKIGSLIEDSTLSTGLDTHAIITMHNVQTSDGLYASISDYDRITSILAELEVRYALENTVLDKHTAPTVFAPENAFRQDPITGEWTILTGGAVKIGQGEQLPGYMTWDGSLDNNHVMIDKLEKHLYSLSEMGAVVNDDAFGASQGYEALETRLTNARLKARRVSSKLTLPLCKLIDAISQSGYKRIMANEIGVVWNDGIPNNEYRDVDIATKKMPLMSLKRILVEHFGMTEEQAVEEIEQIGSERGGMDTFAEEDDSGRAETEEETE